jgi:NADPH:quinone reductase-like Zn-dependent oxidoreductase
MAPLTNRAAYLTAVNTPLEVRDAPIPVAGANEIIIKNAAIAINPLD